MLLMHIYAEYKEYRVYCRVASTKSLCQEVVIRKDLRCTKMRSKCLYKNMFKWKENEGKERSSVYSLASLSLPLKKRPLNSLLSQTQYAGLCITPWQATQLQIANNATQCNSMSCFSWCNSMSCFSWCPLKYPLYLSERLQYNYFFFSCIESRRHRGF